MKTLNLVGLLLGVVLGYQAIASADAQAVPKITASGWSLCVDFATANVALTVSVDGAAAVPAVGVIWTGSAAPFLAKMPIAQLPAAARAVGRHTAIVTAPSRTETLVDGSIVTIPGGSVSITYDVIAEVGSAPTNIRWIKGTD